MGNLYTRVTRATENISGNYSEIWWCPSPVQLSMSGTPFSVTVYNTAMTHNVNPCLVAYEVSGLTGIIDAVGNNSSNAQVTALTVTNGAADVGTNNLVIGAIALGSDNNASGINLPFATQDALWSPGRQTAQVGHTINSASGATDSAAWTWTSGVKAAGVLASFRATSAPTVIQVGVVTFQLYTPAQMAAGVVVPLPNFPAAGNALIFAFALGAAPGPPTTAQVTSAIDSNSFCIIGG